MDNSPNQKLDPEYLRHVINRRRTMQKRTDLFDHSVPDTVVFHGILRRGRAEANDLSIYVGDHHYSPYVVHLKEQQVPEMTMDEDMRPVYVNLLLPERHFIEIEDLVPEETDDLTVSTSDIAAQLGTTRVWRMPKIEFNLPSLAELEPMSRGAHLAEKVDLEHLAPKEAPEDILAFLDLPEEEEVVPEKEMVALEQLDDFIVESEPESKPLNAPKTEIRINWSVLKLPEGWPRALAAFILVSFVIVAPLHAMNLVSELKDTKSNVLGASESALASLESGASAALVRDLGSASSAFSDASTHFGNANESIRELGTGMNLLLETLPIGQGKDLLEAGEEIAIAGERIADGFVAISNDLDPTPTSRLAILLTYTESAIPHLEQANHLIAGVNAEQFNDSQAATLTKLQAQLPLLVASLKEFQQFGEMFGTILGADGTKRYLAIFQNNTEIRPTGGFMGSFAEIDVNNGEITRLNIPGGGTYDLQGSLKQRVIAPGPLQLLKARWEFQDTNWFADFPTSARKILDFYQNAGNGSIDGIIAVNATYIADFIELLGPIDMDNYDRTITGENFVFEAQRIVELEYDKEENKPKAFIGDLAPILLDRAIEKTGNEFLSVLDKVNKGLLERDIQIYFAQDDLQREVLDLGWGGEVKWTDGDYLMVVDTNLGGGKTDGVIEQDIDLVVNIDDKGRITNTVTVKRTHFGIPNTLFTGVNNVDYLRIYVPKGSELLEATGFSIPDDTLFERPEQGWDIDDDIFYSESQKEIDPISRTEIFEESGKTVFGNWVQTKPGTASKTTFTYRLPFTLNTLAHDKNLFEKFKDFMGFPQTETYSLTIQKQSGILDRDTTVQVIMPEEANILWSSHELEDAYFTNATDGFFAALVERAN